MAAISATVLDGLRERVAPTVLAGERTLPAPDSLAALFPDGGIVRGRSIVCSGPLATTLATTLIAPAVATGSWACLLDLPMIGVDALSEQGVALERVVAVSGGPERWADLASAAADGFDLIVTAIPDEVTPAALRRLVERLRRRGAVLVVIASGGQRPDHRPDRFGDTILTTAGPRWSGIAGGVGHLRSCEVELAASGRRCPGVRRQRLALIDR